MIPFVYFSFLFCACSKLNVHSLKHVFVSCRHFCESVSASRWQESEQEKDFYETWWKERHFQRGYDILRACKCLASEYYCLKSLKPLFSSPAKIVQVVYYKQVNQTKAVQGQYIKQIRCSRKTDIADKTSWINKYAHCTHQKVIYTNGKFCYYRQDKSNKQVHTLHLTKGYLHKWKNLLLQSK